jgi:FixJ family two-component response regulator
MKQSLILIVDEDEAVRNSLRFSLGAEGFAVRAFASGGELLAATPLPAGDCFVIDQHTRDMTGLDLIRRLRARNFNAPAVLIVSRPNPALRARAAASGVSVVEKPLLDFTLIDSVRQSIAHASEIHTRPQA